MGNKSSPKHGHSSKHGKGSSHKHTSESKPHGGSTVQPAQSTGVKPGTSSALPWIYSLTSVIPPPPPAPPPSTSAPPPATPPNGHDTSCDECQPCKHRRSIEYLEQWDTTASQRRETIWDDEPLRHDNQSLARGFDDGVIDMHWFKRVGLSDGGWSLRSVPQYFVTQAAALDAGKCLPISLPQTFAIRTVAD